MTIGELLKEYRLKKGLTGGSSRHGVPRVVSADY